MVLPRNLKNESSSTGSTDFSKPKSLAPFNPNIKESRNTNAGHLEANGDGNAGQGTGELTPAKCNIL